MSRWNTFLEITTGRGLETRDRAGRVFAMLLGTAIILITCGTMADALSSPTGLTDASLTLLLGVLTLLVGTVSGYLARIQHTSGDSRAPVGTILTVALGTVMVLITGTVLWNALTDPRSRISANTVSLLTALLGGGIGAAASYLGLPKIVEGVPNAPVATTYVAEEEEPEKPADTPREPPTPPLADNSS